jgi:hypothetical protein
MGRSFGENVLVWTYRVEWFGFGEEHIMSNIATGTGAAAELATGPQLTAADRCDACGAQAYVRVVVNNGELLFCAHHAKKHEEKLSTIAQSWHDESARLFEDQRA